MNDQFKRILEIIRRTGDRMVVTDTNGKDVFVVMDIDDYEALLEVSDMIEEPDFMEEPVFNDTDVPPELENTKIEEIDPLLREAFPAEASVKISEETPKNQSKDDKDEPEEHFYLEPIE